MNQSVVSLYPLAGALKHAKVGKRIQPVSQALCGDIIKRLEPSLAKHKNCDLVDIFPGAGLLSTKLHSLLKPRRHVLLEPQMKVYGSFLNPLLQTPNTPYRHLPLDPYDILTYDRLFDEGHLPEQSKTSTNTDGLNNSLLVLTNLTGGTPEGYSRGFLFMRFLESYLEKTLLNRYGLVRMIGLLPTVEGDVVLPKQIRGRHRTSLLAECVGKDVAEVASSSPHYDHALVRGAALYNKSHEATLKRQKGGRVYSPEDRELGPLPLAPPIKKPGEPFPARAKRDWYDEFEELHERVKRGKVKKPPKGEANKHDSRYAEYAHHGRLLSRFRMETRNEVYALELAQKEEEIRNEENGILRMLNDPKISLRQVNKASEALESKRSEMLARANRLKVARIRHELLSEEIAGYHNTKAPSKGPMLLWDRRPYEPMIISPDEVFPEEGQVTVIDFQPDPDSAVLKLRREHEETGKNLDEYHELVRSFSQLLGVFSLKGLTPINDIIGRLFPGRPMSSVLEAIPTLKPYAVRKVFEPVSAREQARNVFRRQRVAQSEENMKRELLSFTENCLGFTALRHLPAKVVWDITVEWFAWPGRTPGTDISRLVGGGMSELVPEDNDA